MSFAHVESISSKQLEKLVIEISLELILMHGDSLLALVIIPFINDDLYFPKLFILIVIVDVFLFLIEKL
jgi:hypothetical protein